MGLGNSTAAAMAEKLGERLKQARLNQNRTQAEMAKLAGVTRKMVINAEKGKVPLEIFISLLSALNLTGQLDHFLPKQDISPIQLAQLEGKKRQRATGQKASIDKETPEW